MTPLERQLIGASRRSLMHEVAPNVPVSKSKSPRNTVRAELIREILLGLNDKHGVPRGVWLRGAFIEGVLDLRDCVGVGGVPLPPLVLQQCVILGDSSAAPDQPVIDGRHVRLSRLSLSGSQIGRIDLADATLGGDLNIKNVSPIDDSRPCQVSARQCRIEGSVVASGAKLRIPHAQRIPVVNLDDYALHLGGAHIAGSLELFPDFSADGGVSIRGAHVCGNIWAEGAVFSSTANIAFFAQSLRCDGVVALRAFRGDDQRPARPCLAQGDVDFSFSFTGSLDFGGIRIESPVAPNPQGAPAPTKGNLNLSLARVQGAVYLGDIMGRANNESVLIGTRMGGGIFAMGACIADNLQMEFDKTSAGHTPQLHAANIRVEGNLLISDASGTIDIELAHIGGALKVEARDLEVLNAKDAEVRGSVTLSGRIRQWEKNDALCFDGGNYRGEFNVEELSFRQIGGQADTSLSLEDARIERDLKIKKLEVERFLPWADGPPTDPIPARACTPSFYPGWLFVEALSPLGSGEQGIVTFLWRDLEEAVLLTGEAAKIFEVNERALSLTDESVLDYLRFFSANVRGDDGAFLIVESPGALEWGSEYDELSEKIKPAVSHRASSGWLCKAIVYYGGHLFEADFRVDRHGAVAMTEDALLGKVKHRQEFQFAPSVRIVSKAGTEAATAAAACSFWIGLLMPSAPVNELSLVHPDKELAGALAGRSETASKRARTFVSLRGLRVAAINHDLESSWGDGVMLRLEGFQYDRVEHPDVPKVLQDFKESIPLVEKIRNWNLKIDAWFAALPSSISQLWRQYLRARYFGRRLSKEARRHVDWLARQYQHEIPQTVREFEPQPYDQLARVLRNHGHLNVAKEITFVKLTFERRLTHTPWSQFPLWIMERCFSHGLFAWRGIVVFVALWMLGTVTFDYLNYGQVRIPWGSNQEEPVPIGEPVLVVDALSVSTMLSKGVPKMALPSTGPQAAPEARCGHEIEPLWYALDVLVPLIDLRQEERCTISSREDAWPWRWFKAIYAVIGAIATSLVLLTVSGVLRGRAE